jgi:hypothetical protein
MLALPSRAGRLLQVLGLAVLVLRCQASSSASSESGSDFSLQGEYAGTLATGGASLGVQVVANGQGRFTAAFLTGGLPGAGWDGMGRSEGAGSSQSGGAGFPAGAGGFSAALSSDGSVLNGKSQGDSFSLRKVLRQSPTLLAPAPANATVLFDGGNLDAFVKGTAVLDSGLLLPQGSASSGAVTTRAFGDFTLHLEFREPFMPDNTGQARGNSGVYLQGRYELQILDSFGLDIHRGAAGEETQECGAFYQLVGPRLNMSFPPLSWQTYDVVFTKAVFDSAGKVQLKPALVTVRLNGVLIHENQELKANTLLGDPVTSADGPIRFQAHGDPVKFRNIWIVEGAGTPIRPALPKQRMGGRSLPGLVPARTARTALTGRAMPLNPASGIYFRADANTGVAALIRGF